MCNYTSDFWDAERYDAEARLEILAQDVALWQSRLRVLSCWKDHPARDDLSSRPTNKGARKQRKRIFLHVMHGIAFVNVLKCYTDAAAIPSRKTLVRQMMKKTTEMVDLIYRGILILLVHPEVIQHIRLEH
jgi:hypothetical protein